MAVSGKVTARRISGEVLQRLRSGRGLVQEEMAERLGKARSSLAGWEAGRGGLNLENLVSYLDELGVTMEEFGRHFDTLRDERRDIGGRRAARAGTAWASFSGSQRGLDAAQPAPMILQANQAVVMVLAEPQEERAATSGAEGLQPWVQDLFKRAERLFPGPEEMLEPERETISELDEADTSAAGGSRS